MQQLCAIYRPGVKLSVCSFCTKLAHDNFISEDYYSLWLLYCSPSLLMVVYKLTGEILKHEIWPDGGGEGPPKVDVHRRGRGVLAPNQDVHL